MTGSVVGGIALALVTMQLVATMLFQYARVPWIDRLDQLGIVPGWRFFVQEAARYDVAVAVRWQRADGTFGPWREIEPGPRRRPWHWLWDPGATGDSMIRGAIHTLDRRAGAGNGVAPASSLAYATLLSFARAQSADSAATALQFVLMRIADGERARSFESAVHPC